MRNKKIHIIILLCFALFLQLNLFAQNTPEERRERIQAQKVAMLTRRMNLTVEESQKFWPIYNEYEKKREEIQNKRTNLMQSYMLGSASFTDADYTKMLDTYITLESEETKLLQEYNLKFQQVLPKQKVVELYITEHLFKNFLLKTLNNKAGGGGTRLRQGME